MDNESQKTYTFHVSGMHCKACTLLTESELQEHPRVVSAVSSLKTHSVTVTGTFGESEPAIVAEELTRLLEKHGYRLSVERPDRKTPWSDFKVAFPIALVIISFFILLQKIGLVNLVDASQVSLWTAFVIGIVASLSTCMAVVGGLVLSMSATFAKEGDAVKPQVLFHVGRLISFFVLGGVIGSIGANVTLGTGTTFVLSALIGIVMLILGINLLDVFPWAKRLQPAMPQFLSKRAYSLSQMNHQLTPFLVGMATFFLPCGFTQSMQLYTLSTGSFVQGALTMGAFALGTLPVLALVSFSSLGIRDHAKQSVFFKTAGLVVIAFSLVNLINSLVVIGVIAPVFTW